MVTPDLAYQLYRFTFAQIARADGVDVLRSILQELQPSPDADDIISAVRGIREDWFAVQRMNAGRDKSLRRDNMFVDLLMVQPEVWL